MIRPPRNRSMPYSRNIHRPLHSPSQLRPNFSLSSAQFLSRSHSLQLGKSTLFFEKDLIRSNEVSLIINSVPQVWEVANSVHKLLDVHSTLSFHATTNRGTNKDAERGG